MIDDIIMHSTNFVQKILFDFDYHKFAMTERGKKDVVGIVKYFSTLSFIILSIPKEYIILLFWPWYGQNCF